MTAHDVADETPRPDEALVAELGPILTAFRARHPASPTGRIEKAYEIASRYHDGQFRKSGEPYITHPLTVANILAGYGMDADTLAAAILHDTIEDTELSLDEARDEFGDEVAEMIDGVTKLDRVRFSTREEQSAATIRKMMIAMAKDVRVLLIKLADRLHNIRTIAPLSEEKQQRIAEETLELYAPLAHRLGVQEIKHEMEDRCFAILFPRRNAAIIHLMELRAPQQEAFIEKALTGVRAALDEAGIKAELSGRPKHPYSIYRKMMESNLPFEEIHDLIGIRVIVEEMKDCYAALGVVHTLWPPLQGRFKDYVAMPKFNLYQSLHTTVVGPDGKPLEVQIRSHDMHERAEFGIAAHWRYKEGSGPEDLPWISDIRYLQDEHADPAQFLASLKIDLYQDEVFAVTPKGDVIDLPKGATPLDFAYKIHTEVGHRCVGAKVNGRLVPLSTELTSGDIVEIITSKAQGAGPSRDWQMFVKTSRAAAKIRQWFSRERREAALSEGKDKVIKAIAKEGLGLKAAARDKALADVADDMGYHDLESLYVAVGENNVHTSTIATRLSKLVSPEEPADPDQIITAPTARRVIDKRSKLGVIVEGLDDVLVRIAACCGPVPGDGIVGFVTVGRGVSVHRADCTNIGSLSEHHERIIDVSWDPATGGNFRVWLQVEALDRPRLLRDVTSALSDLGANITASSSATRSDRVAVLRYEVELSDHGQLSLLINDLRGVDGVFDAFRLALPTPAD